MKKARDNKGKSLIDFPISYTVIDIETTGLSPEYNEIIELSAIKITDGKITDQFSSLVQPTQRSDGTFLDDFIIDLTGITDDMLLSAPKIIDILPEYLAFLGDSLLIGHNINFDINFLYDNSEKFMSKPLTNDFIDTMRLARRLHPELAQHRLFDMAVLYGINYIGAHRALKDCFITNECYQFLRKNATEQYGSIESFLNECQKASRGLRSSDIIPSVNKIDIDNPLYGKVFVFTGMLEKMSRREAMQVVVDHGGINGDSVTKKTNYLVLGNNDYCSSIKDGKSTKQKRAETLKLKGNDIDIIPENVFYEMISDIEKQINALSSGT